MEMRVVVPTGASVHASQWPGSHEVDVRVEGEARQELNSLLAHSATTQTKE